MTTVHEDWSFDKFLPSDLDVGHAAIEELMTALGAASWEGMDLFRIQMAIEEAVVNAIEHGNKKALDKKIRLVFDVTPEKAVMTISDEGAGFDHRNVADPTTEELIDKPRGRGVMLMRELMNEVHFNEVGNQVVMIKLRSPEVPE
ncbi:MAG: ATP-binding protein [Planctomycetota bacterium]|jgi:serine/threonine-protein kinase RsbW|nr:ATP-binding protein [Planctomycetota bacterium]